MTSIPKPLKFLHPYYKQIKEYYESLRDSQFKKQVADLISVLGITMSEDKTLDSVEFALLGTKQNLDSWGHQYLRSLAGEVATKYNQLANEEKDASHLDFLIDAIAPHCMKSHEEPEAVDLLAEVEQLEKLVPLCTENNYKRVCKYLISSAPYAADQEEMTKIYETTYRIYFHLKKFPEALLIAQKMNNKNLIDETMNSCDDEITLKQLCLMLGR